VLARRGGGVGGAVGEWPGGRPRAARTVPPPDPAATDAPARLAAAVGARPAGRGDQAAPTAGTPPYGVAAYLAADALRARPRGEAVEVSVRQTADGGRLTVARRTDGGRTVAIEAQIA
jgi:hypothetical protein